MISDQTRLLLFCSISLLLSHSETAQYCVDGDLRIQEINQISSGFVQYCLNSEWSAVCVSDRGRWQRDEAIVACRQLGYQGDSQPSAICLDSFSHFVTLDCPNSEVSNLQECGVMAVEDCSCTSGTRAHALLDCSKVCTENEIRLEGGSTDSEGRVEVCVNGRWGTVQTYQKQRVAEAVCNNRNLNLSLFSSCLGTQYGYRQSKPVYYCDVSGGTLTCSGDSALYNHVMDLGVVCGSHIDNEIHCSFANGQFRLTNGSTNREGRVEVCVDGRWGTVCNNSQEGTAGAVCSQLGFPAEDAVSSRSPQITSDWPKTSYYCYSNSTCLAKSNREHTAKLYVQCSSHQDVVTKKTFCAGNQEGQFRFVNGSSPNEGRVEVCMNGGWRPVCGSGQNDTALAVSVCSALGYSEDPVMRTIEVENGDMSCCYTNATNKVTCDRCSCNRTIQVGCQACKLIVQQIHVTSSMSAHPKPEPSPTVACTGSMCQTIQQAMEDTLKYLDNSLSQSPVTLSTSRGTSQLSDQLKYSSIITPLGSVSGILAALLAATVIGWIVTCIMWRRSVTFKRRKFLNIPEPTLHRNESYSVHQLDNHIIYSTTEPTPTSLNYSSLGPNYDVITRERLDTNDVIDHNQQSSNTQPSQPVNPTPVRDETSRNGDDFYDAEEHTYSVVNKKKAKKTSEDGEGEREEPPDYEMAVPGETSWGVMDEGHAYNETL